MSSICIIARNYLASLLAEIEVEDLNAIVYASGGPLENIVGAEVSGSAVVIPAAQEAESTASHQAEQSDKTKTALASPKTVTITAGDVQQGLPIKFLGLR